MSVPAPFWKINAKILDLLEERREAREAEANPLAQPVSHLNLVQIEENLKALLEVREEKVDSIAEFRGGLEARITFLTEKAAEFAKALKRAKEDLSWLERYVQDQLERLGVDDLTGQAYRLQLVKNPGKTEITDQSLLPAGLIKTRIEQSVDKSTLLQFLKEGPVPGAELRKTKRLKVSIARTPKPLRG